MLKLNAIRQVSDDIVSRGPNLPPDPGTFVNQPETACCRLGSRLTDLCFPLAAFGPVKQCFRGIQNAVPEKIDASVLVGLIGRAGSGKVFRSLKDVSQDVGPNCC